MNERPKVSRLSEGIHAVDTSAPESVTLFQGMTEKERIIAQYGQKRDMSKIVVIPAKPSLGLFDTERRKRVVVYCRVSTDGISQTSSFELQKNHYLKYVRQKPEWKLVGLYSDEGITATSTKKRIGLLTMLDDAKAGKFDIIVVKNLSRLSRNLMDCMEIIYMLRNLPHPVGILFETENMFTLDKNIDFTLQVLSLVAQEESHKKSEAMGASYQQRYGNGQYSVPDLFGYDSIGTNEIVINEEEAKTVQLIFMMYLAGIERKEIAEILMKLGRKTHTHKYKDGRVKEGIVRWTADSVLNILQNERRCGDVLAQKTYTPNYLDHKSVKNNGVLPQYYAREQHPAIISPEDFYLTQRLISANRGGWNQGVPTLQLYQTGILHGFVSAVPAWFGFSAEDYNRAALRASGISEQELEIFMKQNSPEVTTTGRIQHSSENTFSYRYTIDSDDYESYPESAVAESAQQEKKTETFQNWVDRIRSEQHLSPEIEITRSYDLSECEVVRAQFFSMREKAAATLSYKGISFNKNCFRKLGNDTELIKIAYNPIERMIIISPEETESEKTLRWVKRKNNDYVMCHCKSAGLMQAIFQNMNWNAEYKYRLIGNAVQSAGQNMLLFHLEEPIILVSAKEGSLQNMDTDTVSETESWTVRKSIRDGFSPETSYLPNLDGFSTESETKVRNIARSRAIYYDEMVEQSNGILHVNDLGEQQYTPECIQRMREKGITPVEGWDYLRGMAIMTEKGFAIYPAEWAESFGTDPYHTVSHRFSQRMSAERSENGIDYGWTVGLDLPTLETVKKAIAQFRTEKSEL